ncbi:MAG TPA: hypothetical protein VK524_21895 [Polyangiaceae bacterium]|nr:hypothetical protein [Polyangiaceae bacterium]
MNADIKEPTKPGRRHVAKGLASVLVTSAREVEGSEMSSPRMIEIPVFVDVHDVMGSMKCSRTTAYAHMRAALRRAPGVRGHIRVPLYVWQRYVQAQFDPESSAHARPIRATKQDVSIAVPIPITRPRTKPWSGSERPKQDHR